MKKLLMVCTLSLLLLAGCGSAPASIPDDLDWRAHFLLGDDLLLAAAEDWTTRQNVPLLDVTAQVDGENITLTDHAAGTSVSGTLTPSGDSDPNAVVYILAFPDHPEGYAVYGVAEQMDGTREATLYLTVEEQTLYLTAPLLKS